MANLVTAAQVKTRLFEMKGMPVERRPAALTDAVIDEYIQRLSAEVLSRLGINTQPDAGTLRRDAIDGITLDLVLIALRRDFFGLKNDAMTSLNQQERNAFMRLDALAESPASDTGGAVFRIGGARGP